MSVDPMQLAICRERKHEAAPPPDPSDHQAWMNYQMGGVTEWHVCRWCGVEFKNVTIVSQVENTK